ncbi:hypothetical protein CUJ83_02535 [Methanocella sp. CWC-04]|uniref:Uncharacterized protein n=1 Tax=Methanooceanicella nereidis TaxID=2052831 RepID=A0AAP2RDA7_9EURY|nr:hypothetical protein [Methanocella sp. CWC-04]MCD1293875.1 hypothetical protein [Methanocella sp. CWC-04]
MLNHLFNSLKRTSIIAMFICLIISLNLLSSNANAAAQIIQANGEYFTFAGHTTPNSPVSIVCTTTISIPVTGGNYEYSINGLQIPEGSGLSMSISPVTTLTITGKAFGVTQSMDMAVVNNKCGFAVNKVPGGKYDVGVSGKSSADKVSLIVSATMETISDAQGDYSVSMSTSGLPYGIYHVKANGEHISDIYYGIPAPDMTSDTEDTGDVVIYTTTTMGVTPTPSGTITPSVTATPVPSATKVPASAPSASLTSFLNIDWMDGIIGLISKYFPI